MIENGRPVAAIGPGTARTIAVLTSLAIGCVLMLALNLCIGSVPIAPRDIVDLLFQASPQSVGDPSGSPVTSPVEYQVLWQIRLPRAIGAAVLGSALALSGYLLQTFFDNPIAGPYILGVSSGARLSLALAMVLAAQTGVVWSSSGMVVAAFAGSLGAMALVLLLARRVRSRSMLIVGGVMVGYVCSAGTDFLVTFAADQDIANLHNWGLGSFSGISWEQVAVMAVVVAAGLLATLCLSKPIGAYLMGEEYARSVGVRIGAFRVALIAISSLLAACVTAFAGPVSFVGIAVPFLAKRLLGSARPLRVIPTCALGGAIFCLTCDLISRTAFSPVELSLSAVTAFFGVPVVLAIMLGKKPGASLER